VDCAGGVSTVPPGSSIGSSNRWKSCRGVSSDAHTSRGRVGAIASIAIAIAKTGVSVAWVAAISQNVGISLSFPLGDMDDTSRVGNVTSSTGVSSSDSRDGSRGSSKGGERGRGGNVGVAGSNWSNGCDRGNSSGNGGHSGDGRGSVAKTGIAVSQTSVSQTSVAKTIGTVEGISLSLPLGDMDDTSRVGDITSGTSVSSSNSRDGSRGKSSNVHRSRGGDTGVASSNRGHSSDGSDRSNCRGSIASIAKTSVAETSVAKTSVAKTSVAETSVSKTVGTIESIGISLSLPLGDMNNTSRVGDIASGTSVSSSDSRDGSRGKSSNVHGSRRRHTGVSSSIWGSVPCVAESSIAGITSIAEPGVTSAVAKEVGVSLSGGCRGKEESCKELVHVGL